MPWKSSKTKASSMTTKSIRKVEGRSNSSKTTTPSKSSKTKASSMTTTPLKSSKSKTSSIGSGNSFDWYSSTTSQRSQAEQVRKFIRLIFNYYKRSWADRVQKFVGLIFNYYKRSQADKVRKLGLIFTYYKSEVSGRSGLEIRTRPTPRRDC